MAANRFSFVLVLRIVLACAVFIPARCFAQENPDTQNAEFAADAEGCVDLALFPKLGTSVISSCQSGVSVEVTMPLKPDAQGNARQKSIRGPYEFREYKILQGDQQEQAFENLMQLLPMAGFTVKYFVSPMTITARKEDFWMLVNLSGEFYNVSVVKGKETPWTPVTDAEGIAREMAAQGHSSLYGIDFAPNQTIVEEDSKILNEVLRYLNSNPRLAVVVESHKISPGVSPPAADAEITQKRAQAVVAWLEAHGIPAARLQPRALGRSRPITENDTPLEIQRNERIELAKTSP